MKSSNYRRLKIERLFEIGMYNIYRNFGVWTTEQEGEGEFKKIDSANQLQISNYKNGLKNGTEYLYDGDYFAIDDEPQPKHGKLINTKEYKDGLQNGKEKNYSRVNNGELVSEFDFINGKLDGKVVYYNNGVIINSWEMKYGKMNGKNISRDDDGTLKDIEIYKDDKLNGECIYYFKDGNTIQMIINYKNDLKNGEYIQYGINGEIRFHYWFKNNKVIANFIKHPELKEKFNTKY